MISFFLCLDWWDNNDSLQIWRRAPQITRWQDIRYPRNLQRYGLQACASCGVIWSPSERGVTVAEPHSPQATHQVTLVEVHRLWAGCWPHVLTGTILHHKMHRRKLNLNASRVDHTVFFVLFRRYYEWFKYRVHTYSLLHLECHLRWGWVFLKRTRILSGTQFTTHFIEMLVVETKWFIGTFVNVILTLQTYGQRSSRAAESKRQGNYVSERICYICS